MSWIEICQGKTKSIRGVITTSHSFIQTVMKYFKAPWDRNPRTEDVEPVDRKNTYSDEIVLYAISYKVLTVCLYVLKYSF